MPARQSALVACISAAMAPIASAVAMDLSSQVGVPGLRKIDNNFAHPNTYQAIEPVTPRFCCRSSARQGASTQLPLILGCT